MSAATRVLVVPGPPGLLPRYAGRTDPLHTVRTACRGGVDWLLADAPGSVTVLVPSTRGRAAPYAEDVARHLLADGGFDGDLVVLDNDAPPPPPARDGDRVLVVGDGTACRSERAPGHLEDRSFAFDKSIEAALATGDRAVLADLDEALGAELWAEGVPALRALGAWAPPVHTAAIDLSDDPFGVQYWVVRWTCGS